MQVDMLDIEGLAVLTPRRFGDARGWFSETWNAERMKAAGFDIAFIQDNQAYSAAPGTLRGLHFQSEPAAQTKLVRCLRGRIFDVAVDARPDSPSFGAWRAVTLDAATGNQFLVSKGFLHGYMTLTPDAEVAYKVDAPYAPDLDGAVRWDDPDLAIDWPLSAAGVTAPALSEKDAAAPPFAALTAAARRG